MPPCGGDASAFFSIILAAFWPRGGEFFHRKKKFPELPLTQGTPAEYLTRSHRPDFQDLISEDGFNDVERAENRRKNNKPVSLKRGELR